MFLADRGVPGAYDAFVIGSSPAGLSLALALADAGRRVLVVESGGRDTARSELSTVAGYGHYGGGYWNGHWVRPR
jgi:flavin-dependent dehydrogenase